jgi:hypothetical protein
VSTATAVRTATLTADLDGRIWMDEAAQELFQAPSRTPIVPAEDWSAAFHCYDLETRMPLPYERLPAYRALQEGAVDMELLVAPPGGPERIVAASARALYDADGDLQGVVASIRDITEERHEHVGADPLSVITMCPCQSWQLEVPVSVPPVWVEEALLEHRSECVVLGASCLTVAAAPSFRSLGAMILGVLLFLRPLTDTLAGVVT